MFKGYKVSLVYQNKTINNQEINGKINSKINKNLSKN